MDVSRQKSLWAAYPVSHQLAKDKKAQGTCNEAATDVVRGKLRLPHDDVGDDELLASDCRICRILGTLMAYA